MERITMKTSIGKYVPKHTAALGVHHFHECVERLGQIEDILGDDYDLDRLRVMMNQQISLREEVHERFKLTGDIPLDRLRELIQANKDGRCEVLPCKVGTPVYRIVWHVGCSAFDDESYQYVDNSPVPFSLDMVQEYGKTVFPNPEAAEVALKGETK